MWGATEAAPHGHEREKVKGMDARTRRLGGSVGFMKQGFLGVLLLRLVLCLIAPSVGGAQVTTNITSSGLGTEVPLQPPSDGVYNITGGHRSGSGLNLFHSFGEFSVGQGDIANFLNNTQLPTSNIIARVTDGTSNIDGTIQTTDFGNANLFLINPSGIVFGPNGSVNVGGSLSLSTADYLRFEGTSTLFDMLSSPASLGPLSVAPVVAFGFLSQNLPAPIEVQGSILQVSEGQSLSLVGGDITVQAETFEDGTMQAANLLAPGGQLNLVSVASPGEVFVPSFQTGPNIAGASFTTMGMVMLKEGATLDVSGQLGADADGNPIGGNSGTVLVRGGQLVMDASTILAGTMGAVDGARTAVDIQVSEDVALTEGSTITTFTFGSGRGGDVQLTADTMTIENTPRSIVTATFEGGGVGGDVVLNVGTLSLVGGSSIQSESQHFVPGGGQGGNVIIQGLKGMGSAAETVTLSGGSNLSTTAGGSSDGGQVAITTKSLKMDGPNTSINASSIDVARGGNLVVSVQQATLSGGARIIAQSNTADSNAQPGSTVTVRGLPWEESIAHSVALSGLGSGIISDSFGPGRTGDVAVHAKTVTLADEAVIQSGNLFTPAEVGNVTIKAVSVDISGGGQILSQASHSDAGQITITANTLNLNNGSIATNSQSEGRAGDVAVDVGSLNLSHGSTINTSANGSGRAGDIMIEANSVTLSGGSKISSASIGAEPTTNFDGTTEPPGTAGNVTITATSGSFTSDASTVATSAEKNHGGDISITAQNVQLSNGTEINASSNAPLQVTKLVLDQDGQLVPQVVGVGNAGNITIKSASNVVMENSKVTTEASAASGGNIEIDASDTGMIQLINSRVSTSVGGVAKQSNGGNITIDPQFVVLQNSQIIAQAFAGAGGAIDIIATSAFIADPASIVDASSTLGISGTINIQSPLQNVGGELTALSQEFSSAAALLAQQCAARAADGKFSTFVVAAREGLPMEPGGFLASPSLTSELIGSRLSGLGPQTQLSAVTGLFPKYDARPIQLAKLGSTCR